MIRANEVARLLQELGNTADEVALALRVKGIQGVRNTVRFLNPIVHYVQSQIADAGNLHVIKGETLSMNFRNGEGEVSLPEAVKQFLAAFNSGAYPELEIPNIRPPEPG